jgi:hypothetical protein
LPEALERVILKALAKSPEDRFGTANEMVKALQASLPEITLSPQAGPGPESRAAMEQAAGPTHEATLSRPLWQPILLTAVGWLVGIIIGLVFISIQRVLGAAIGGAIGGLGIGLAWRRIEPSVPHKQILVLAATWALAMGLALPFGPLFFVPAGLAGWLTGLVLRQVQPRLKRKQIAIIALGWGVSWLLGGILFTIATTAFVKLLSGLLVIVAMLLAGGIGATIMFRQYLQGLEGNSAQSAGTHALKG